MANAYVIITGKNGNLGNGGENLTLPVRNENGTWTPGEWHTQSDYTEGSFLAEHGFGITNRPAEEWEQGVRCFEVEHVIREKSSYYNGIYCSQLRLIRELSNEDLERYKVFQTGSHTVTEGTCAVDGDASVLLLGNAEANVVGPNVSVEARDRSRVMVRGKKAVGASIEAFGHSSVSVSSHLGIVEAYGRVNIELHEWGIYKITKNRVQMIRPDYREKRSRGTVRVKAHDSVRVGLSAGADVTLISGDALVKLHKALGSGRD